MRIVEGDGIRVSVAHAGTLRVDGGAMFGAVPRERWRREAAPDDRNRVRLAMRCLLVETPAVTVLVDTGAGAGHTAEMREQWGIANSGDPTRLEDSLRALGVTPEDIDLVVLTHLHFDHAGGATRPAPGGERAPAFPSARYVVRAGEWEVAMSGDRRTAAGYAPADLAPLAHRGVLDLLDGEAEIAPGVRVVDMPGHTRDHQGVLVEAGDETVCYPADLVPTAAHVRAGWIMAYDVEPLVTWTQKERWLGRAGTGRWRLVFDHDPRTVAARATPRPDGIGCGLEELLEEAADEADDAGAARRRMDIERTET